MPKASYEADLSEVKFQDRIIRPARKHRWRFVLEDTEEEAPAAPFLKTFIKKLAALKNWLLKRRDPDVPLIYHAHDSRRSAPGFPDLILIHPIRR